jgi:anti-anti-sigma factor
VPQPDLMPLARLMDARFDELVDRLTQQIPDISAHYATLAPEQRRTAALNLYRVIRASVEENGIAFFAQAITRIARDRIAQGGSAEDLRVATSFVSRINLSLIDELAHNEPSAAVPAFSWLDQLSSTSLQIFTGLAQEVLSQQAEELNISIALSERLEQAQRLNDVVDAVFEQLPRLGIDRAIMSLQTDDDPALHEVASVFDRDESVPELALGTRFSPEPLLHKTAPDGVYLLMQIADSALPDSLCEQLAPAGIHALVVFPLRDGQQAHGLLILGYRQEHQFTSEDQRFLALLARMLRNRVANLLLVERLREQIERVAVFQSLVENANDMIIMSDLTGAITYANRAAARLLEFEQPKDLIGQRFTSFISSDDRPKIRDQVTPMLNNKQPWKGAYTLITTKNNQIPVESSTIPLLGDAGTVLSAGGIIRDERERLALIESLRQSNAEQQHTLEQLRQVSTPLIPVMEGILVMPIVGEIDGRRAGQIMETLLQGVTRAEADTIILDITGVPLVDTSVANALVLVARAVRLLGAQAILVGITPEVAQTLVGLGADLSELVTRGDLQSGITYALKRHGYRLQRNGETPKL